jgi:prepilin-type N-terminal cleavage/methylation domain-containing protein
MSTRTPSEPMLRRGMTLVEMMVATTMTLIIMGIVAQLFGMMGKSVSGSRSTMDMSGQVRGVAHQLRMDLAGITVETLPPVSPERDSGYLEIIEGPMNDISNGLTQLTGDCDDVLMFTTRSLDAPFTGRYWTGAAVSMMESPTAEVAWFCRRSPVAALSDGTVLYTLYRRQLLVMEYVGLNPFLANGNSIPFTAIAALDYDISLRREGANLYPNSLGDLTKRESRFLHNAAGTVTAAAFPFDMSGLFTPTGFNGHLTGIASDGQQRDGEDVILTNVIAFDVKVFDPHAAIVGGSGGSGEYVNLGGAAGSLQNVGTAFPAVGVAGFSTPGVRVRNSTATPPPPFVLTPPTYDTWSTHYESNGLNEDNDTSGGSPLIDEGTNGEDDNADGVPDDPAERETSAPYPVALRGVEIAIRCYDPQSRQVRQVTVRHTFVPH